MIKKKEMITIKCHKDSAFGRMGIVSLTYDKNGKVSGGGGGSESQFIEQSVCPDKQLCFGILCPHSTPHTNCTRHLCPFCKAVKECISIGNEDDNMGEKTDDYIIITPAEIEAGMIMTGYRRVLSTNDSFKKDANRIVELAERIKKERESMKGM